MYNFASDYLEGAHPQVMEALNKTNFIQTVGYGEDEYCQKAKDKIKAIEDSFVPPTINYLNPDPECNLNRVVNTGKNVDIKYSMSNSLGFGGHNATLIFKKWR